jgi:hypothetical protein
MPYSASIVISNRTDSELTVFVEPGAQMVRVPPAAKVRIIAEGNQTGDFDVEHNPDYMTVSAWPGASARAELESEQAEPGPEIPSRGAAAAAPRSERPPTFVSVILVGDNEVTVEAGPDVDTRTLRALGGRRSLLNRRTWTFPARDDEALGTLLHALRDLGVAFAWEPSGWPPAAVFAHLRDRGLVQGTIKAVTWRAPGDFQVFEF